MKQSHDVSSSQPAAMDFLHHLPEDIVLHDIFPRFNFPTWVRAAAVCRRWMQLALLAGPPLDLPLLWITTASLIYNSLFDLRSTPICRRPIPRLTRSVARIIGVHGQYILYTVHIFSGRVWFIKIVIYNPFTGQNFQLPLLRHSPETSVLVGRLSSIPDPSSNKDCLVAVANHTSLFICRHGDQDWVSLPELHHIEDLLFYKDNLYCVYDEGQIISFKVHLLPNIFLTRNFIVKNCTRNMYDHIHYLVEFCGELLFVTYDQPNLYFSVQWLEQEEPKLVKMDDLGDRMLFVGGGCSTLGFNVGETSEEFFTKNCIYFINYADTKTDRVSIGKYNLGTGEVRFKFIACPPMFFSFRSLWINPN